MLKQFFTFCLLTSCSSIVFTNNKYKTTVTNHTGHALTITTAVTSPLLFSGVRQLIKIPAGGTRILKLSPKQEHFLQEASYLLTPVTRKFSIPAKKGSLQQIQVEERLETSNASRTRTVILSYAKPGNAKAGDKISLH